MKTALHLINMFMVERHNLTMNKHISIKTSNYISFLLTTIDVYKPP